MPIEQAQLFFNRRKDVYDKIDLRVPEPMNTDPAERAVQALRRSNYKLPTQKLEGPTREAYFGALNTERSMMMIIMLILIMITSLNIITGVVMLVKNKTRDIAISPHRRNLSRIGYARCS